MTQERVKCPFCCELILGDAMKCRFCGEWFSKEEESVEVNNPHEDSGRAWDVQEEEPMIAGDFHEHFEPTEGVQEEDGKVEEVDDAHKGEHEEAVEESPGRVVSVDFAAEGPEFSSIRNHRRIPWLRIIFVVAYLGIVAALVVSEFNARRVLRDAQAKEKAQDYDAAFDVYRGIIEAFPFSFAIIETQQGLRRICDSDEFEMPRPSWLLVAGDMLDIELTVHNAHLLPFVAWPACVVLLFLVFLTRIRRLGAALLVLSLMIVALASAVAQLSWYGLVSLEPMAEVAQVFMEAPVAVYYASCVLLVLTALMTLTATKKRGNWHMSKMATAQRQ